MRLSAVWLSFVLLAGPVQAADPDGPARHVYVCPLDEHPQDFDHPGSCPICGMELVEKEKRLRDAVRVGPEAEIIGEAVPCEVCGQSGAKVFTVAPGTDGIRS